MPSANFDILDRKTEIHKSLLIEASAGTGKTFSIENLYLRLLLEEGQAPPLTIEEILVVTFTKAATRELKFRIQQLLDTSLRRMKEGGELPDYLNAHLEKGEESRKKALRRIEKALFSFDDARIFTIHGFCEKVLTDHTPNRDQELLKAAQTLRLIRNFFQTEIREGSYGKNQIKKLLKMFKSDFSCLEGALVNEIQKGAPIEKGRNFRELYEIFLERMNPLLAELEPESVLEDFYTNAKSFNKIFNKQKVIDEDLKEKLDRFIDMVKRKKVDEKDFETLIGDGLVYIKAFDPKNLRSGAALPSEEDLNYPHLLFRLKEEIQPLLLEASSPSATFSRVAYDCKRLLKNYLNEEGKYRYDDLILSLSQEMQHPQFLENVRKTYSAAIIDEFQDTDPMQWKIFESLFLNSPQGNLLYLVGDPKQSIYGFREADIYTYLEAKQRLGEENIAALCTNYRSSPSLIKNLNALFHSKRLPHFIHLPKDGSSLPYQQVLPCSHIEDLSLSDQKGSLHFILAEGEIKKKKNWPTEDLERETLFPYIANEIHRLKTKDGVSYSRWAILVRDRYQADRIGDYLDGCGISSHKQRERYLTESVIFSSLIELLKGVLNPSDINQIKIVLGGHIFRWNHHEIRQLENEELLCEVVKEFQNYHRLLNEKGFSYFFELLMITQWSIRSETVAESLLHSPEDQELYQDLVQLSDYIIYHENSSRLAPEEIYCLLLNEKTEVFKENDALKVRQNRFLDAVQILTLHSCKGLEFDFVVPIGLINRKKHNENLIPIKNGTETVRRPVLEQGDEEAVLFQKEADAEKLRLLYVALTRAKYRLYYPLAFQTDLSKPVEIGEASPNELFFSKFLFPDQDTYQSILSLSLAGVLDSLKELEEGTSITYSVVEQGTVAPNCRIEEKAELAAPVPIQISYPKIAIESFSSLEKFAKSSAGESTYQPIFIEQEEKTLHTLPVGKETGLLLHEILEKISFDNPDQIEKTVAEGVRGSQIEEWEEVLVQSLIDLSEVPFPFSQNAPFSLNQLEAGKSYREVEFLHSKERGMMKGFIDLVFEHRDKYYLIDWKSNWLGQSDEEYHSNRISETMLHHHYDLQADIYKDALRRYLSNFTDKPFEEIFGGAYFVFLRGIYHPQTHGIHDARNH